MKKLFWQRFFIFIVSFLIICNIAPTVIFYSKPLHQPIDEQDGQKIIASITKRINRLEQDSVDWIASFANLLHISVKKIQPLVNFPELIQVEFYSKNDMLLFQKFFPKAGDLISFYPSRLSLQNASLHQKDSLDQDSSDNATLYIKRKIPLRFYPDNTEEFFSFHKIYHQDGSLTQHFLSYLQDRILHLIVAIENSVDHTHSIQLALQKDFHLARPYVDELVHAIHSINSIFQNHPKITKRFFSAFLEKSKHSEEIIASLLQRIQQYAQIVQEEKIRLKESLSSPSNVDISDQKAITEDIVSFSSSSKIDSLEEKEATLLHVASIIKKHKEDFLLAPDQTDISSLQMKISQAISPSTLEQQKLSLLHHPIFESIIFHIPSSTITLHLQKDILAITEAFSEEHESSHFNQLIYDVLENISRETSEHISRKSTGFEIPFTTLPHAQSFLLLHTENLAKAWLSSIKSDLINLWHPMSEDLKREAYPIKDWVDFCLLPRSQQHFQFVLYAPILTKNLLPGQKKSSIYLIAKDLKKILEKQQDHKNTSEKNDECQKDIEQLVSLLQKNGFISYPASSTHAFPADWHDDYIFELSDFYAPIVLGSRENFSALGTKILELSNHRQRILTENEIETKEHENLLQWQDEYNQSQANPTKKHLFQIPKPIKNVYWNNFQLSWRKLCRGDDRKILRWGLDLSGGKTACIALKNANDQWITQESDIKQAIGELSKRINKLGVSDVAIRQSGQYITIDFPGSQDISATTLLKDSSMSFHVVNEQFAPNTAHPLARECNRFLQEIWNESVATGNITNEDVNHIARLHLYGNSMNPSQADPQTESAKTLYAAGLRLVDPKNADPLQSFNDVDSRIALYAGKNYKEWHGQTHPLIIVFNNYALQGSQLENIHPGYDPTKGNFLSFSVKKSHALSSGTIIYPRDILCYWTTPFSKSTLTETKKDLSSQNLGWRMAVILNDAIISVPHLESPLRDHGLISGQFSTREINQLASNLKAGSLSFTPKILSETSISPELGLQERIQGITATFIALLTVLVLMISYYRFSGIVASIAVIFNLLIMWAALQNMHATLTLPGLAGIILTVGMAVDANVLIFERIREEFGKTKKLGYAIYEGYKKAFSAIFDSNITTLIAAFCLLHFGTGIIKGFATTLIIGVLASMFSSLFITRYIFTEWMKRTKKKALKMHDWIRPKNWHFLSYAKWFGGICLLIAVGGTIAFIKNKDSLFGMDFTGGFSVDVEFHNTEKSHSSLEKIFTSLPNMTKQDFQIKEIGQPHQLRIFFSPTMNLPNKPFYRLPITEDIKNPMYSYETNPRLVWLVDICQKNGLDLSKETLKKLNDNWQNVSGQLSHTIKTNALLALLFACAAILIYITFRFEFIYAISATIGLVFDVCMTISALSLLHALGMPIQIDLTVIAAILTIIGYSLNDTIIVFDRTRERKQQLTTPQENLQNIINISLNETFSRTLLTSLTTLSVVLCLLFFGGPTLLSFSIIMTIGIIVGTLSTWFIATTVLILLNYIMNIKKSNYSSRQNHANELN